ncbi:hypothetical protein KIPB_007120 [Kipferlia bialata]|uniref:Solute-binding protein family 5 domain-containing protein n=1 Tax=Kipferlia bialata TaxID=797122 RepID=A0A9K3GJQ0_9EUKA|nr:hypothetical protein KIPB_007120 [Kipferlia bialata]|eukprot:g7120.t1
MLSHTLCTLFAAVLCTFVALSVSADSIPYFTVWQPVPEDKVYELFYMRRPIFEESYGPLGDILSVYHSGIAMKSTDGSVERVIQYEPDSAVPFNVLDYVIPNIVDGEIVWDEHIQWQTLLEIEPFTHGDGLSYTGWQFIDTVAEGVTGAALNKMGAYMDRISKLPDFQAYYLFELWDYWRHEQYVSGYTCFDACWTLMDYLYKECGVTFEPTTTKREWVTVSVDNPPRQVDMANPDEALLVLDFYKALRPREAYESVLDFLFEILFLIEGPKYLYIKGAYWEVSGFSQMPWYWLEEEPLPGMIEAWGQ